MDELGISKLKNNVNEDIERKKKFLKRYKKNRACISRLEDKLEILESRLTSIKGATYSDMPKGGLAKTIEELISDKMDLEKRIDKLKKRGSDLKDETYDTIDTIDDPNLVELMEYLFIKCYSMDDVEDMLGLSKRQLLRNYRKALELVSLEEE